MVHDRPTRDTDATTGNERRKRGRDGSVNRRSYLKLAGATAAAFGLSASASGVSANEGSNDLLPNGVEGDVPDANWQLTFNDEFDQGELDTEKWGIGFGWGREHIGWEYVRDEDVWVDDENDHLVLAYGHDPSDGWYSGAVNTHTGGGSTNPSEGFAQSQGYFEASIRLGEYQSGTLPAFWLDPDQGGWPPELDILELFGDWDRTSHTVHWGDEPHDSDYQSENVERYLNEFDADPYNEFVTYGAHWHDDGTDFYVEGEYVGTVTGGHSHDPNSRGMNNGDPMYMMLSNHLDDTRGPLDENDDWPRTWEVDWVRVWEAGEPDDGDDEEPEPIENTILFDGVGTSGGTSYEFSVTGPVEKSNAGGASVNDDDAIDGGHVTGDVGGWRDAYEFGGELEALSIDGPARVIINGEEVDPGEYGDELTQSLTLVGNGIRSTYEIGVSGAIEIDEITAGDAEVGPDDRASGTIERGVHRFELSGELVEFAFTEGGTQAYLGRNRIDPDDY